MEASHIRRLIAISILAPLIPMYCSALFFPSSGAIAEVAYPFLLLLTLPLVFLLHWISMQLEVSAWGGICISPIVGAIVGTMAYQGLHPNQDAGTGNFVGFAALGAVVALITAVLYNFGPLRVERQ